MPYDIVVLLVLILVILTFVFSYNIYLSKSYDESLNKLAKKAWEEKFDRKIDTNTVSFFLNNSEKIDKITWADMEMDSFLTYFDRSFSICGSQALYKKLHSLNYQEKDMDIVNEILENKEEATWLGKNFLKFANFDNLDFFDLLKNGSYDKNINSLKVFIYICFFLNILCFPLFFVNRNIAIILFIILRPISAYITAKVSKITDAKRKNFSAVRNLADLYDKITASDMDLEGLIKNLDKYKNVINSIKKNLSNFYFKTGADVDFLYSIFNNIFLHESRLIYKSTKFINENLDGINSLYREISEIDMYLGIAISYSNLEDKCLVDFNDDFSIEAKNLHNPILYYKEASIPNSFVFKNSVLLTGSNASGKSTFLRSLGANIILGSSLGFAFAEYFSIPKRNLYSTINIQDSIEENVSYFMAETIAIKRMIENKSNIYILDEIFKGTNTIDRISTALFTLKYLSAQGLVIAATHDIELTKLLDNFNNYHFEEIIKDNDIVFDYKLKEGPAKTRNAIKILEINNYPREIVERAKEFSKVLEKNKSEI